MSTKVVARPQYITEDEFFGFAVVVAVRNVRVLSEQQAEEMREQRKRKGLEHKARKAAANNVAH